ncbi:MAG: LysR family transcriptional regulator [Rhodospirillaceae bacterium]|nr:LysR family transcriptional regulator [Rhodospirillaceae bacterium]
MEIRHLQHFVAVAEELNFTRAARRVNIVQSALSTSVRALEEELGTRLFVRNTRQVRLTTAGGVFLEKARAVLEAVRDARLSVAQFNGLEAGTLSIGTVQSLPAFLDLPALISEFHQRHPGMEIRLCQGSSQHLLEKVRSGRLDLAFLPLCEPPDGLAATMIACEALVLVCAPGHPLAGRRDVPLEALQREVFVDFEPDWGTRRLVDRSFAEAGVDRRIAFEVNDLETLLNLVNRGLGVALLPEAIAESKREPRGIAHLAEPEICWELVVAYVPGGDRANGPADRAPQAFLDLMDTTNGALAITGASSGLA